MVNGIILPAIKKIIYATKEMFVKNLSWVYKKLITYNYCFNCFTSGMKKKREKIFHFCNYIYKKKFTFHLVIKCLFMLISWFPTVWVLIWMTFTFVLMLVDFFLFSFQIIGFYITMHFLCLRFIGSGLSTALTASSNTCFSPL